MANAQRTKKKMKKLTRCTASQTIKSAYCEFQTRSGVEW
jgi:hypothetical protein